MKVHTIGLSDFRSYGNTTIDGLSGMNVFGGLNGRGKSSIVDAVSVALTGTCRGAESGRGLDELRRTGGRKWQVELGLEVKPGVIDRIVRREGEGPRCATQDYIDGLLGIPPARVRACLYAGEVLRLPAKDAQRLILDLCDTEIEVPQRVAELLQIHVQPGLHGGGRAITVSELDVFYKNAYELRTAAGREAKAAAVSMPVPPEGHEYLVGMSAADVLVKKREVDGKLADIRAERDGLVRSRAAVSKEAEKLAAQVDEMQRRLDNDQREFREIPEAKDVTKRIAALRKEIEEQEAREFEIRRDHPAARRAFDDAKRWANETAAAYQRFLTVGAECESCHQKVTAAHQKKTGDRLLAEKEAAAKDLAGMKDPGTLVFADMGGKRNELSKLERSDTRRVSLAKSIEEVGQEILQVKLARTTAEAKAKEATSEIDGQIAALDARITKGAGMLDLLAAYHGGLAAAEGAVRGQHEAEARHRDLEWLVEELGPKGPLRAQAAGGTAKFQEEVNGHLAAMGFTADFGPLLDATGEPLVNGRPARLLSTSQAIRFGIAFQIAIATWSGLGIVTVDDWDRFDAESIASTGALLLESGHQVLLFAMVKTEDEFRAKAESIGDGGPAFFLVTADGEASTVEALSVAREAA